MGLNPFWKNIYRNNKSGTVITTDDNSDNNAITLQTDGTNSKPYSKFYNENQWALVPLDQILTDEIIMN